MPSPQVLLATLEGLGVAVTVTEAGGLQIEPASLVPGELKALLRANRAAVVGHLKAVSNAYCSSPPASLTVLPSPLLPLIRAAVGEHLPRFVPLAPGQIVADLNGYVLACAALYAVNFAPEEQLKALWLARRAWAS